jgi:hypothetical protein
MRPATPAEPSATFLSFTAEEHVRIAQRRALTVDAAKSNDVDRADAGPPSDNDVERSLAGA